MTLLLPGLSLPDLLHAFWYESDSALDLAFMQVLKQSRKISQAACDNLGDK